MPIAQLIGQAHVPCHQQYATDGGNIKRMARRGEWANKGGTNFISKVMGEYAGSCSRAVDVRCCNRQECLAFTYT